MEFWGVEVKPGQTVKCEPGEDKLIHLSQAALGETKNKGSENVPVYVKLDNQKLVIGTLSAEKCAQISYDLVFEKEFELSHTSKSASVYFCGYKTDLPEEDVPGEDYPEFDSEEDVQLGQKANGKAMGKEQDGKPKSKVQKQEDKPKAVKEEDEDDEDDSEESDDEDDSEESDDDKDMAAAMADSDDDEDEDDDEDDESSEDEDEKTPTPKKAASGKKRPVESATKTPAPEKKAKLVSPAGQKTGGNAKKSGHVATPHPAKQGTKTPAANNDKSKQQSPKSGSVSCKPCNKSFNSENALQAHTKAKHSAGAK